LREAYLVLKAKNSGKDLKSQRKKREKRISNIESECPMSKCRCAGWGKYEEDPLRSNYDPQPSWGLTDIEAT